MEQTYIMIKPDGVKRMLVGAIIQRFENRAFTLMDAKLMQLDQATAKEHYSEHYDKYFFTDLTDFVTSGPVLAMVWQGEDIIRTSRKMIGATNPKEALPGTIRGDYGESLRKNVIHGSDSRESAAREIKLFFETSELVK